LAGITPAVCVLGSKVLLAIQTAGLQILMTSKPNLDLHLSLRAS